MIHWDNIDLKGINLGGINLSGIKLGMPSGKGTGGEETFDPASFDQAWTVTGLTNDSPNKTTIKNLTGNGIDLTLNNFAFAGNSGYGLYSLSFSRWGVNIGGLTSVSHTDSKIEIVALAGTQGNVFDNPEKAVGYVYDFKVKVTGLGEGSILRFVKGGSSGDLLEISEDGIYNINTVVEENWSQKRLYLFIRNQNGPDVNISIEQIPDYEGYLVTDGVDDSIISPNFNLYDNFTFVGEWKLLPEGSGNNAGIVKARKLYIYNISSGMLITINSTSINNRIQEIKSLKAVCSDGRVYDENWNEIKVNVGEVGIENNPLNLGFVNNRFTTLAFKNGAFYSDRLLTKDQCIAAYNYLQTLKEK